MPRSRASKRSGDQSVLVNHDHNQVDEVLATSSSHGTDNPDTSISSALDANSFAAQPASNTSVQMRNIPNHKLPHDKKRRVQWAFLLIGMTTLLPWNFLITPMNYWNYKFRNVTANETDDDDVPGHTSSKTDLQIFFSSYLSMASNVPFLFMLILLTTVEKKISQDFRTILGLVAISFLFLCTTILVKVDTDAFQFQFFKLTLASVVVLSCFSAVLQSAFVSTAACFPSRNMLAYTTGQSLAGLLAALAQIISTTGHGSPTQSALYYFITADFVLIITLTVYLYLPKSEYFSFWSRIATASDSPSSSTSASDVSTDATVEINQSNELTGSSPSAISFWQVFVAIKWQAIANLNVYWVTMSVFPPLSVLVNPIHPNRSIWSGALFTPITNFLLFALADFFGRAITKRVPIPVNRPISLAFLSITRWILVPLLMLCNAHPRTYLPVVFGDTVFIFLILIAGLSNGYLFINAMINGPKYAPPEMGAKVGFISVLMLGLGVAAGSITSNLVIRLL